MIKKSKAYVLDAMEFQLRFGMTTKNMHQTNPLHIAGGR